MSIQAAMDEALGEATDANSAIDRFYEKVQVRDFDWGSPGIQEFDSIMSTFAGWVMSEKKKVDQGPASPLARAEIVRYIQAYVKGKPTAAFLDIHPAVFGIQLAMRVRRPRSMDQDDSSLCGAVAVIYNFAKFDPLRFAQFALHLFFLGQAMFGEMEVQPTNQIRQNFPLRKTKIPWAVDYVTLVSLRQCTFFSDKLKIGALRGADETTLPGQIGLWLTQAGYHNVEDHTFFAKNQVKLVKAFASKVGQPMHLSGATGDAQNKVDRRGYPYQNLQLAEQALRNGKFIIIFSDGELGRMLRGDTFKPRTSPTKLGDHHWMAVRQLQIFSDTYVKLKVITWSTSFKKTLNMEDFIPRYNGFVSAEP
ncbi:MAG TPA: hypothetical protein VGL72_32785 [Bryobacteraceae bacterium]